MSRTISWLDKRSFDASYQASEKQYLLHVKLPDSEFQFGNRFRSHEPFRQILEAFL